MAAIITRISRSDIAGILNKYFECLAEKAELLVLGLGCA